MNRIYFSCAIAALGILSACQPPRVPVKRPLEIKNKPVPTADIPRPKQDLVRIGIRVDVESATVSSDKQMNVTDLISGEKYQWEPGTYTLAAAAAQVTVDGERKSKKMRLQSTDADSFLKCKTLGYRGDFIVIASEENKVTVINELDIDDYLKGVLPREVVVTWHEEALKVQAVASRTYLASHLGSHGKQGFDLCSDVHCQVYGGTAKEHPRTTSAVDETKGQILVYNGKPIGAFFHSNCGGSTEQIQPVWGSVNQVYLPRKKCGFGTADPRYHWQISLSDEAILSALKSKTRVQGTTLRSLQAKLKSPSGRAQIMKVVTDADTYELSGNEFRIALHPEKIRSTLFTSLKRHGEGYEFKGRGWGHGVGMCQWGAKGQGEQGRDYREILLFYYPHTQLKIWSR